MHELRACLSEAEAHVNGDAEDRVSEREIDKFRTMVQEFYGWLTDMALVNEYGELEEDALEDICEDMAKSAEDLASEVEESMEDMIPVAQPIDMDDDDYDWDEHDEEG